MAATLMPTYEYHCKNGHHFERVLLVADYQTPQACDCGAAGRRIISLPRLVSAAPDVCYDSPIDGRPITSMAQRREDMLRNNCREYDPEMKKDAERFRRESEAKLEAKIDQHIEATVSTMPARKRERLAAELSAGADATITRDTI